MTREAEVERLAVRCLTEVHDGSWTDGQAIFLRVGETIQAYAEEQLIRVLAALPVPVRLALEHDSCGRACYSYLVGASEENPFGRGAGVTVELWDAIRLALDLAARP